MIVSRTIKLVTDSEGNASVAGGNAWDWYEETNTSANSIKSIVANGWELYGVRFLNPTDDDDKLSQLTNVHVRIMERNFDFEDPPDGGYDWAADIEKYTKITDTVWISRVTNSANIDENMHHPGNRYEYYDGTGTAYKTANQQLRGPITNDAIDIDIVYTGSVTTGLDGKYIFCTIYLWNGLYGCQGEDIPMGFNC